MKINIIKFTFHLAIIMEDQESLKSEEKKASVSECNNRIANVEVHPKTNKEERDGSQLSSSRDSAKKIFLLYASIGEIEKMNPWSLISSSISILIQIFISIIYCIVFYIAISNYITNYHEPTSKSMMDFSKQISNVGFGTMVSLELEYYYLGLVADEDRQLFFDILKEINKNSLNIVRDINYEERDASANLEHQIVYKTLVIQVVDDQTLTMIDERFIDFVDQTVYKMNRNANILETGDFGTMSYDALINMQKNYGYFLQSNSILLNIFQTNFFKYNDETSSLVQNYLIIFLLLYFFVKLFEFNQWLKYHAMIEKILMIFLRINSHEILGIHHCTEEILKILKDPSEKYLHTNIPEAYLESNSNKDLIESKSLKDAKGKKKNLDLTFRGFKGLSKMKIYLYFLTISGIMLFYFVFNFYYWIQNNSNIRNLIELDSFFLKIYIYSTSTLCTNNLLIRQNIISNPEYEKIGDELQTKETEHVFLLNALNSRIEIIQNVTANQLLQTGLQAKSNLNNAIFDNILNGDLCQVLRDENEMNLNFEGTSLSCENLFNGGFINGIANAENEYIRLLKANRETYTQDIDPADLVNIEKQKKMIYEYIKDASHMENLIGDYFLSKSLSIFYRYINEFYNALLAVDIQNLDIFAIVSLNIVAFLNVMILIYINTAIRKKYKSLTLIISLIPFERLVNDEQTGYLIKKFLKEYEQ